ncbi:MAG: ComEC family competence protein [Sphingobacteriales bacterium]|nr:MAG: ComEC family competence protein [Sphingobacteriales bacterium]
MKQWPLNKAYFWETAPFFRILLPLIAGIVCYDAGVGIPVGYALVSFAVAAVTFIVSHYRKLYPSIGFIAISFAVSLAGWLLSYYDDIHNDTSWFGHRTGNARAFVAVLSKDPQEKDKTYKLPVSVVGTLSDQMLHASNGKAFLYLYKEDQPPALQAGDTILIPDKWQLIKNSGNPFEFDYARYCRRNNISYQQFLSASELVKVNSAASSDRTFTDKAHTFCIKTLQRYVKDTATLGIIQAMLIGDEAGFDPEIRQAYAETGIIHVIAISGSHLAIFFILISFLLSWIRNKKYQWIKYAIALPLIWFYVLMAGAPPSAIRAAAMFSILALGFMLQKSNNSLNQLLATAFILLCANPMWLFAVGFQLSFIAVLALIIFYKPIYKLYTPTNTVVKLLWSTVAASIAAEVLVAPLVIYYFHIFPVLFIVANIVAYILMSIVLIAGMAIVAFGSIPPLASLLASASIFLTKIFNIIIVFLQSLNPDSFKYLQLSGIETIMLYIVITGFAILLIRGLKPGLYIGLTVTCLLASLLCYDEWTALHQQQLIVYNMNRGSHVELISGKRHSILHTDTATSTEKKQYALNAAHIAWHAWKPAEAIHKSAVQVIGKRTVALLDRPQPQSKLTPTDYLIINYPVKAADIQQLQNDYNPKAIILSGYASRRVAEECKQLAAKSHINLHTTILDGAYVIE